MRVFISHSSKDKDPYCNAVVRILREKLGKDSIVYDDLTFEAGEKSIDEINRTTFLTTAFQNQSAASGLHTCHKTDTTFSSAI